MGSLRDLKKADGTKSETDSDRPALYERLHELVMEHGNAWTKIAKIIETEGYREGGKVVTDNALRKRHARWKESQRSSQVPEDSRVPTEPTLSNLPSVPSVASLQEQILGEMGTLKSEMGFVRERLAMIDTAVALVPEKGMAVPMQELISLNNQLLEQVLESHRAIQRLEKQIEEQPQKTDHTGIDTEEQSVTSRDLLELLKELTAGRQQMQFIEEESRNYVDRDDVLALLEEKVQEKVDTELKTMLSEGGSFSAELSHLIDQRLRTLFSAGEPVVKTAHAGPGRGKKGKTHKKFSASLEEGLFERVKSLPGQFSGHLSNALDAYLAVMEEKKRD